ncbi:DUF411 domain-containing protein [uncultured Jannaschia sp.]|uniref:DUF411 domain-containing protein n=1 Tax=uncultured Jannaschia sp. TaxID=293347 RepID=UPI00262768BE|nr:DUF411 domain-containing protein [uncultured Jannaschia sp.]
MNKTCVLASLAVATIAGGIGFATLSAAEDPGQAPAAAVQTDPAKQVTIWRDPGCGCCDTYADYLERHGYEVTRIDDRDFDKTSVSVGIPREGLGCHLAKVDGYFVSGLVPVEIIERLVTERPEIAGITLPGMPSNAPGMAHEKSGTLKTYAFEEGGIAVYADE